jgi:hypothetical protein
MSKKVRITIAPRVDARYTHPSCAGIYLPNLSLIGLA